MSKKFLAIALLLYCMLFALLFPWYRYVFDLDGIGYLDVTKYISQGEFTKSINGYWSPLHSWLLLPFFKQGFDVIIICKYINGAIGSLTLISFYFLLKKISLHGFIKKIILFTSVFIFLYFVFYELFADILVVFIITIYINLIFSKDFIQKWWKLVACGIVCGLGYYAKYYLFYFFLIHFIVSLFILLKQNSLKNLYSTYFKKLSIVIVTLLVVIIPWWIALSRKYERFTISTPGRMNSYWLLNSAREQPRVIVYPPPRPEDHASWNDPTYWPGNPVTPFTNAKAFFLQLKIMASNFFKLIDIFNSFSIFSFITILLGIYFIKKKRKDFIEDPHSPIFLSLVFLLPLGYLPLVIESRYIWATEIILLVLTGLILNSFFITNNINKNFLKTATTIACLSFLIYPYSQLKELRNKGKDVYEISEAMNKKNIHGKLLCNFTSQDILGKTEVISYLTDSHCCGPGTTDYTYEEILNAIHQYKIDYFLFFYTKRYELEMFRESLLAKNAIKLDENIYPGLMIAEFTPHP